jgi:hypothetical protein
LLTGGDAPIEMLPHLFLRAGYLRRSDPNLSKYALFFAKTVIAERQQCLLAG